MSEYEAERLRNIERNKQLLATLGLDGRVSFPSVPKASLPVASSRFLTEKQPEKEKRTASPKKQQARAAPAEARLRAVRRSARLAAQPGRTSPHSTPSLTPSPPTPSIPTLKRLPVQHSSAEDSDRTYDPEFRAPLPTRNEHNTLIFDDWPIFEVNVTPEEMLRQGSFGGTAFRSHYSTILRCVLPSSDIDDLPREWWSDLPERLWCSAEYDNEVNAHSVKAGQSLADWEKAGWVHPQDPRGWFQWYCRFYLGRRTEDDARQIKRWMGVAGPNGRFRKALVKRLLRTGGWQEPGPEGERQGKILRQTLQHWAYRLTKEDFDAYLE